MSDLNKVSLNGTEYTVVDTELDGLSSDIDELRQDLDEFALNGFVFIEGTYYRGYISSSTGKIIDNSGYDRYRCNYYQVLSGNTYKVKSTGSRLVYGLYSTIADQQSPIDGQYYVDNDNPEEFHDIVVSEDCYLLVYYETTLDETVNTTSIVKSNTITSLYDSSKKVYESIESKTKKIEGTLLGGWYIQTSTGKLVYNGGANYKSMSFPVKSGKTYEIHSNGNRFIFGLFASVVNNEAPIQFYVDTDNATEKHYITADSDSILVCYYSYQESGTSVVYVSEVLDVKALREKHLNILIFGNSYATDSWGYVPFLLYKNGITVNIYIYYRGSGSPSRLVAEWEDTTESGTDIYGNSHLRSMIHIDTRHALKWDSPVQGFSAKNILEFANNDSYRIDKWDIITLQPVSSEQYYVNNEWTMAPGLEPAFRQIINLINTSYTRDYTLGFFETYNRIRSIGNVPISALDNRIETMKANESSFRAEPFGLLLPVGSAIFSARTNSLLASTDVSDIGNLWADDYTHLQEGLPCYIASLTICQALYNKYFPRYSVLNDNTVVTSELRQKWANPYPNGSPKTVSSLYWELGKKCAVVANNSPFDITPIYAPSDNASIVYDRSKYWADTLIDTSDITGS